MKIKLVIESSENARLTRRDFSILNYSGIIVLGRNVCTYNDRSAVVSRAIIDLISLFINIQKEKNNTFLFALIDQSYCFVTKENLFLSEDTRCALLFLTRKLFKWKQ